MKNGIEQLVGPMNLGGVLLGRRISLFIHRVFGEVFMSHERLPCTGLPNMTFAEINFTWCAAKRFTMMDRN